MKAPKIHSEQTHSRSVAKALSGVRRDERSTLQPSAQSNTDLLGMRDMADQSAPVQRLATMQRYADARSPTVAGSARDAPIQRVFGELDDSLNNMSTFNSAFSDELSGLNLMKKREIYMALQASVTVFDKKDIPAAIAAMRKGATDVPAAKAPERAAVMPKAPKTKVTAQIELPAVAASSGSKDFQPHEPLATDKPTAAISGAGVAPLLSSQTKSVGPASEPKVEPLASSSGRVTAGPSKAGKEPATAAPALRPDPGKIIVNYVWLGNRTLGALEKFNIYSWRTLGHLVQVYAMRFDGKKATAALLGLASGDAQVVDLSDQLGVDESTSSEHGDEDPKSILRGARGLIKSWMGEVKSDESDITFIYNLVDMVKSYLGATQRGIVLDLKVGPSEHMPAYAAAFDAKFVSYSRGGKTGASVENQSMGTMQESEDLRIEYAANLKNKYEPNKFLGDPLAYMTANPRKPHFNHITGWHGRSFDQMKSNSLNVVKYGPDGTELTSRDYPVSEPGSPNKGPFRVFKRADVQTNQSSASTATDPVPGLVREVYREQLAKHIGQSAGFAEKADAVAGEMA